jgi:hypothetical protein
MKMRNTDDIDDDNDDDDNDDDDNDDDDDTQGYPECEYPSL